MQLMGGYICSNCVHCRDRGQGMPDSMQWLVIFCKLSPLRDRGLGVMQLMVGQIKVRGRYTMCSNCVHCHDRGQPKPNS